MMIYCFTATFFFNLGNVNVKYTPIKCNTMTTCMDSTEGVVG